MTSAKRIFVAVGISEKLLEKVSEWQERHAAWPVRWIGGKNLHITLFPPWHEKNVGAVIDKLETLERKFAPFEMRFNKIEFGSDPRRPRLIWASGKAPPEIITLRNRIAAALSMEANNRPFLLHLTLARFREENFHRFPVKTLSKKVDWRDQVKSFILMESRLLPDGAEYTTLAKINLRN